MEPDLLWRERTACGHYRQLHNPWRLDRGRSQSKRRGRYLDGVVNRQSQQKAVIQGNHRKRVKINRHLPNRRTGVVRGGHSVSQRPRIAQQSARLVHRPARTAIADKQRNKSTRLRIALHSQDIGNRAGALVNIAAKGLTAKPPCRESQNGDRNHLVPWFSGPRKQLDARTRAASALRLCLFHHPHAGSCVGPVPRDPTVWSLHAAGGRKTRAVGDRVGDPLWRAAPGSD